MILIWHKHWHRHLIQTWQELGIQLLSNPIYLKTYVELTYAVNIKQWLFCLLLVTQTIYWLTNFIDSLYIRLKASYFSNVYVSHKWKCLSGHVLWGYKNIYHYINDKWMNSRRIMLLFIMNYYEFTGYLFMNLSVFISTSYNIFLVIVIKSTNGKGQ